MARTRVTSVGSSHVRGLRDAIQTEWSRFSWRFRHQSGQTQFCPQGRLWTIRDVHIETKRVAETHPDYLRLVFDSSDLAQGELTDSRPIQVANNIVQLAHPLCLTSGTKGLIFCSLMKRKLDRYLSTPCEVDRYSERVVMANDLFPAKTISLSGHKKATWVHWSFDVPRRHRSQRRWGNIGHIRVD